MPGVNCIGIDPSVAKGNAFAWLRGRKWVTYATRGRHALNDQDVLKVAKTDGATHAVIEDGYVGPNKHTALQLAEVRGALKALAQQVGLEVVLVKPRTWQVAMLTVNGYTPKTRCDIKNQSKWVARLYAGRDIGEDESDALCIAVWGNAQRWEVKHGRRKETAL